MSHAANIVTGSRIASAILLLLFPTASPPFWCLYAWCGISDMVDGTLARRSGSQSAFGARLDSAADLAFVAACLVKILPVLLPMTWLIAWVALIVLCKAAAFTLGFALHGRFAPLHTVANKAAGLAVFLSVPAVVASGFAALGIPACLIATFAACQELNLVRQGKIDHEGKVS